MKNLLLTLLLSISGSISAQNCPFDNTLVGTMSHSFVGETITNQCVRTGEYITLTVTNGSTYNFSTCTSTSVDVTMTLYDGLGQNILATDDDGCGVTGGPALFNGTVNFDGTLQILIDEYPCLNSNTCVTLSITLDSGTPAGPCTPSTGTDVITTCTAVTWIDGNTYTSSNNSATHTLIGAAADGCDSIVTLDLTFLNADVTVINTDPILVSATSGATYQWLNCLDNFSIIDGKTSQSFIPSSNGSYAVEVTFNNCIDTSDCYSVFSVGLEEQSALNAISIFPNPFKDVIFIEMSQLSASDINIYNLQSQLIYSETNISTDIFELKIDKPSGIYILEVVSDGERKHFKVVKE